MNHCGSLKKMEYLWKKLYFFFKTFKQFTATTHVFMFILSFKVAIQKLKKDVTLLMLTQSELTYQLGKSQSGPNCGSNDLLFGVFYV